MNYLSGTALAVSESDGAQGPQTTINQVPNVLFLKWPKMNQRIKSKMFWYNFRVIF